MQVSEQERDKAEHPARDAGLRGAPFGFGLAKESLCFRMHLAMFAPHEARQTLAVIGDKARRGFIGRPGETARARISLAHLAGGETLEPHCRMSIVRVQPQAPLGERRIVGLLFGRFSLRLPVKRDCSAEVGHRSKRCRRKRIKAERALSALAAAMESLQAATPNKGGRREPAMPLIERMHEAGEDHFADRRKPGRLLRRRRLGEPPSSD